MTDITNLVHNPDDVMHVVPCLIPGLTPCTYRLIAPNIPTDNVMRCQVWCMKWRLQRDREHRIQGCHPDYPKD